MTTAAEHSTEPRLRSSKAGKGTGHSSSAHRVTCYCSFNSFNKQAISREGIISLIPSYSFQIINTLSLQFLLPQYGYKHVCNGDKTVDSSIYKPSQLNFPEKNRLKILFSLTIFDRRVNGDKVLFTAQGDLLFTLCEEHSHTLAHVSNITELQV